ncbi:MAG: glycosyltransferase, partial [Actinomycetota bacterium]|nr:glycosyltransferase [Actinomycetota bacterium]
MSPDRGSDRSHPWIAPIALVTGLVYLAWRGTTGAGVHPALFWPLLGVEAFAWVRMAMRLAVTWELTPNVLQAARSIRTVDVIVTAYAEPVDIVRASLIGCRELRYPHRTWLVDDRRRTDLRDLAAEMGVEYVSRTEPTNGRTGALNHVLGQSTGELLLLLDADQVPLPDAIHRTVGFFDDPLVALVQTPLEYQNRDSVLHVDHSRHERSLTNEVINPGRDRLGAALWEGPAAMLRRAAIESIGGIPTTGTTGELQATIQLQGAGWLTRFHGDVIAYGLAAHDLRTLLRERARWARGHVAACTTADNPLWARGLTARQRLSH